MNAGYAWWHLHSLSVQGRLYLSENKYACPIPLSGSLTLFAFDTFLICRSHRYHRAFQALQAAPFLLRCSKVRKPLRIGAVERLSKRHLPWHVTSEEVCAWTFPLIPLYAPRLFRLSVPEDTEDPIGPWWHRLAPMGFEDFLPSEDAWFSSYPQLRSEHCFLRTTSIQEWL